MHFVIDHRQDAPDESRFPEPAGCWWRLPTSIDYWPPPVQKPS